MGLTFFKQLILGPVILSLDCVFTLVLHKTTMVKAALLAIGLVSGFPLYFFLRAATKTEQNRKTLLRELIPAVPVILLLVAARLFFDDLQPLKGSRFPGLPDLSVPSGVLAVGTAAVTAVSTWLLLSVRKPIRTILSVAAAAVYGAVLFRAPAGMSLYWLAAHATALLLIAVIRKIKKKESGKASVSKTERNTFFAGCALLALLTGLYLPGMVIMSSPLDFIDIRHYQSPLVYLISSFALAAGCFLLWIPACWFLAAPKVRRVLSCGSVCLALIAAVNGFFFGNGYGTMSSTLQYEQTVANPLALSLLNAALCLAVAVVVILIWRKDSFIT